MGLDVVREIERVQSVHAQKQDMPDLYSLIVFGTGFFIGIGAPESESECRGSGHSGHKGMMHDVFHMFAE